MLTDIKFRNGEARLLEKLFENDEVGAVIQEAMALNLTFDRLRIDRVTLEGPWKTTMESTIPSAVLYFTSDGERSHLIVQRSKDEKYGLFTYRWTN